MALQEKQLGQARAGNTTATSVYSPASSTTAIIKMLTLCNTSAATASFRIFVDDDGTTYDETTALYWDVDLAANQSVEIDTFIAMNDSSGNLAYRTSVASAITITVFGAEVT